MNKLIYNKKACSWMRALPIGNGHSGAMLTGGMKKETVYINDDTMWSGYPVSYDNPKSLSNLQRVRELILSGNPHEADALISSECLGEWPQSYLPMGNIIIKYKGLACGNYTRSLEMKTAVHTEQAQTADCASIKTTFASYPDKIIVHRISSSRPFSCVVSCKAKLRSETVTDDNGGIALIGNAPDFVMPNYVLTCPNPIRYNADKGMAFATYLQIKTDGALTRGNAALTVKGATYVEMYIATATGYKDSYTDPETDRAVVLAAARAKCDRVDKNYAELYNRHKEDYSAIYGRMYLKLARGGECAATTDELVKAAKKGNVSNELVELFYNYGRYLAIAGGREGSEALNLQGIWNKSVRPPWSSDYTTNINVEMNYWLVGGCNMEEIFDSYYSLIEQLLPAGRETARINYGCRGFACNVNADLWRKTSPVRNDPTYAYYPLGSVWLTNELYSHACYIDKMEHYKKVLPIMREAALFASDWLIEHKGDLITCPATSPELGYRLKGRRAASSYATSFDTSLIWQLFNDYMQISDRLGVKDDLYDEIAIKISKLYPLKDGATGLLEWGEDYESAEKGHRHFSPLYGVYPGNRIGYHTRNEYMSAALRLLDYRVANGSGHTGWSAAWAVCLYARMHEGQKAKALLNKLLGNSVYYNLFDKHPPTYFQIDGNLGAPAGINEMLCQYEDGAVELLPALPDEWKDGEAGGLKLPFGITVDMKWKNGKVTQLHIKGDKVKLRNVNLAEGLKISNAKLI